MPNKTESFYKSVYDKLKSYVSDRAKPGDEHVTKGLLAAIYNMYQEFNIGEKQEEELYKIADPNDCFNEPAEYYFSEEYNLEIENMQKYLEGKTLGTIEIKDICWVYDSDNISEQLYDMDPEAFSRLMEKSGSVAASDQNFSVEDAVDYVRDAMHHGRLTTEDVFGLPDRLTIEAEDVAEWKDEDVTNFLEERYGYFVDGYARDSSAISTDDMEL